MKYHPTRPISVMMREAHRIIDTALIAHQPRKIYVLVSGGNDSMVLLDSVGYRADAVFHVDTTIGIPETEQFVKDKVAEFGKKLVTKKPPIDYEELVLNPRYFGGFPGPAGHHFMYARLKERCVRQLVAESKKAHKDRILLLTGVRNAESRRRAGYSEVQKRIGAQVWVNPLIHWTSEEMAIYRAVKKVPTSEVAANLHMSGECLCGSFAKPGELDMIGFFYPTVADWIRSIERKAVDAGLRANQWGMRPPRGQGETAVPNVRFVEPKGAPDPMCSTCTAAVEEFILEGAPA